MEQHVAQIAPAGAMRLWAEPETGGESYIPLAPSKRPRSRAIAAQTVRLLGGAPVQWFGRGGLSFASGGFTYAPTDPASTLGVGGGMDRYRSSVDRLKSAWDKLNSALADQRDKTKSLQDAEKNLSQVRGGKHTAKELAAAEKKLSDARAVAAKAASTVRTDRGAVNAADRYLGLANGAKAPAGFDLKAYAKQLQLASAANSRWEAGLANIGKRAGGDIEETLRGMGADGENLVYALSHASGKAFTDIVNNLKKLAPTAKAVLGDYTNQLKASAATSKEFQNNLLKLASMGYGDLASQLAAQGDDNAAAIAAAAAKSPGGAAAANAAAKSAASALSGDDLTNALTLIGVLRSKPGAGIADVIGAGLDLTTIKALLPKISGQLKALPAADTAKFLAQVAGQSGATAMARGGILDRPTTVLAAEAGHRESWIPWDGSARSAKLLATTAAGLGYHLVPAGRYAGSISTAGPSVQHNTRHNEVHLHGAKQSSAEQAADIVRHMSFVG
jgi:hypothetical protein